MDAEFDRFEQPLEDQIYLKPIMQWTQLKLQDRVMEYMKLHQDEMDIEVKHYAEMF